MTILFMSGLIMPTTSLMNDLKWNRNGYVHVKEL